MCNFTVDYQNFHFTSFTIVIIKKRKIMLEFKIILLLAWSIYESSCFYVPGSIRYIYIELPTNKSKNLV